ncbi:MAG: EAL domain-containing protein [Komarekiella atlantica HA4396-MV6]|nr:EAL domain-containing protein [Komarekiella atlantica HA4396-MV6]
MAAQLSQERFRRAILDAPVPIMLHAEDGEVMQINRTWSELTGYSLEEIPTIAAWAQKAYGKKQELVLNFLAMSQYHNGEVTLEMWRSRVHPDDLEQVMQVLKRAQHECLLYSSEHLIDRWVIRTLFVTQGEHYRNTWSHCQAADNCQSYLYAINLSGASINDDQFIEFLYEQFALHQIPPQTICFEITETVAITNLSKASQFIGELRNIGCRFALDNFGSGMSSFAYLKNLPVDFLKIDGSFIKHILDNPVDSAVVEAINQVGQAIGIQTIAEFVENDAILEKIKALGVNYAQGYGIAEPCAFDLVLY